VIDLELALTDLAEHLDIPDMTGAADALTRRLAAPETGHRRRGSARVLLAAAAAIVVMSAGVVAVAPARDAVAGWLGIGSVEISRSTGPARTAPSTTRSTTGSTQPSAPTDLAAARRAVQFDIATPRDASPPAAVTVDRRVPGGLVALNYGHFTLVEIASDKTQPPPLMKLVGNVPVEPMSVHGHPGLWIPAIHEIGYLDRSGRMRTDTVRRSGPVLLWERDGVTYRVEGPHTLAEAQTIADSIG
jgi:hypothetical protein